ncbi:hypothetical protein [Planctomyces sp. SH-PL62]|uniref:hypothetical protein n=1 Tax=Planctomyces sp. SH-PL62 TaxID=1636152 RepID=UPI0012E8F9A8|nr:hypothetical protein [Planctomyces sp. SH-PL62]
MRFRVWFGFILAASLRGLAVAADDPRQAHPGLAEPIDLKASTAIVWDAPDGRWVVLSGAASAVQGGRGMTAGGLVVRITQQALDESTVYQAELYAEGEVRAPTADAPPRKQGRAVLQTVRDVRVSPNLKRLEAPPEGLDILARAGFPAQAPAVAAPRARSLARWSTRPAGRSARRRRRPRGPSIHRSSRPRRSSRRPTTPRPPRPAATRKSGPRRTAAGPRPPSRTTRTRRR